MLDKESLLCNFNANLFQKLFKLLEAKSRNIFRYFILNIKKTLRREHVAVFFAKYSQMLLLKNNIYTCIRIFARYFLLLCINKTTQKIIIIYTTLHIAF